MHANGLAFVDKDLLQKHSGDLACFDVCVRHKVAFRAIGGGPAEAKALFLGRSGLYKDEAYARNLGFDAPA